MSYEASLDTLHAIARLVHEERPDWDAQQVLVILLSHQRTVTGTDLAIAALRAASNHDLRDPRTIGWRGPHWDGLTSAPPEVQAGPRCSVCQKIERRCVMERPGKDDDHAFSPAEPVAS